MLNNDGVPVEEPDNTPRTPAVEVAVIVALVALLGFTALKLLQVI